MIFPGHFYRSVRKPGVEVITDVIDHVLATGFDARAYVRPMEVVGESGLRLDEAWADGPRAYRSVAVPGFPNLFMLMGRTRSSCSRGHPSGTPSC
jgi:cation diffusion facilitator CzcD-associated flavoprotein CzcO